MVRRFPLAVLALLLFAEPVFAGVYEGWAAARRGDFATALSEFQRLAEQGNAVAQYNLGVMYANGMGVPRDAEKAADWFHDAASGGDARAQYNLGNLYADGQGVPRDLPRAAHWYAKAAAQGLADAQYNLGRLYYMGTGVPRDFVQAYVWMHLAADQGVALAVEGLAAIGKFLKPETIAQAQEQARAWKANHAKLSVAPR